MRGTVVDCPVHHGHLILARDAIEQLARQQRMRFIPCLTTDDPLTVLRDSLHKRPPAR